MLSSLLRQIDSPARLVSVCPCDCILMQPGTADRTKRVQRCCAAVRVVCVRLPRVCVLRYAIARAPTESMKIKPDRPSEARATPLYLEVKDARECRDISCGRAGRPPEQNLERVTKFAVPCSCIQFLELHSLFWVLLFKFN